MAIDKSSIINGVVLIGKFGSGYVVSKLGSAVVGPAHPAIRIAAWVGCAGLGLAAAEVTEKALRTTLESL